MVRFTDCETYHTGLYKPHTIKLNLIKVSVIYTDKNDYIKDMEFYAMVTDKQNNQYEIYIDNEGILAFPVLPDKIKGFYPWL